MPAYRELDRAALLAEQEALQNEYRRYQSMGLKLDMSRGKPDAEQLDLSLPMLTDNTYKDKSGLDGRNYGPVEGTPEARAFFGEMLGAAPKETIVGNNSSLQMMYQMIDMAWRCGLPEGGAPWSKAPKVKWLCPSPGYDRHFRVTESFGFELILVPMLPTGPDMDLVEELVKDEAVKGMWCIPVYSNPDGYVYSDETVKRLAAMQTAAADFRILWDNAYVVHHLTDVAYSCPNILAECKAAGCPNRPFMFCSTSKITFAGGGVGAMAMSAQNIKAANEYLGTMTIGSDKLNQLRHVRFLQDMDGVAAHMKQHAALLAPKFRRVLDILETELSEAGIATWTEPKGGYFISFFAPEGCATRIVALCAEAGVVLTGAGAAYPYGKDPADSHIRIAPSFPPMAELEVAARLLCIATRLASIEKLLG